MGMGWLHPKMGGDLVRRVGFEIMKPDEVIVSEVIGGETCRIVLKLEELRALVAILEGAAPS